VINIIMGFRDMGCYRDLRGSDVNLVQFSMRYF
jgi:hypothetical protein